MKLIHEYPAVEIKSEFISLVSKIDITGEDEFKADFNSPELMWRNVVHPILSKDMCGECTGSGVMAGNEPCKSCMATGKLDTQRDCMYSSLMSDFVSMKQSNRELLDACEASYRFIQSQGKENSLIGMQIKMTIERAFKK